MRTLQEASLHHGSQSFLSLSLPLSYTLFLCISHFHSSLSHSDRPPVLSSTFSPSDTSSLSVYCKHFRNLLEDHVNGCHSPVSLEQQNSRAKRVFTLNYNSAIWLTNKHWYCQSHQHTRTHTQQKTTNQQRGLSVNWLFAGWHPTSESTPWPTTAHLQPPNETGLCSRCPPEHHVPVQPLVTPFYLKMAVPTCHLGPCSCTSCVEPDQNLAHAVLLDRTLALEPSPFPRSPPEPRAANEHGEGP